MIEILQIIFFSLTFSLILFFPFNIFSGLNFSKKINIIDKTTINLAINLNILLFLSYLPFSVQSIQPILFVIYIASLIYLYKNDLKLIIKFLLFFLPVTLIFFALAIDMSSEMYLGFDAKKFYYIKTLFFHDGKTIFDLNILSQSWHPHYASYLWGFFWTLSFVDVEYFGRLFYLFLFCYSFFAISNINKEKIITYITFLFLLFLFYEYDYFKGHPEILIFSLLVLISKYFFLLTKNEKKDASLFLFLIFLLSNLILWIKSEGSVYFFIILLLLILQNQILLKKRLTFLSLFIFSYFLKLAIYKITGLGLEEGLDDVYNLSYILGLDPIIVIDKLLKIVIWFFYYSSVNIFLLIFMFLVIYEKFYEKEYHKKNFRYNLILLCYLFLIIIFILFAYIFRDAEIMYAIRTTMDRLVMTASGFLVFPSLIKFLSFIRFKNLKFD